MDNSMKVIQGVLGLAIVSIFLLILDSLYMCPASTYNAVAFDKEYAPERTSTGVGTDVMSNGKVGTVVTTSTESEKYIVFAKLPNGRIIKATTTMQVYFNIHIPQNVRVTRLKGGILGLMEENVILEAK